MDLQTLTGCGCLFLFNCDNSDFSIVFPYNHHFRAGQIAPRGLACRKHACLNSGDVRLQRVSLAGTSRIPAEPREAHAASPNKGVRLRRPSPGQSWPCARFPSTLGRRPGSSATLHGARLPSSGRSRAPEPEAIAGQGTFLEGSVLNQLPGTERK